MKYHVNRHVLAQRHSHGLLSIQLVTHQASKPNSTAYVSYTSFVHKRMRSHPTPLNESLKLQHAYQQMPVQHHHHDHNKNNSSATVFEQSNEQFRNRDTNQLTQTNDKTRFCHSFEPNRRTKYESDPSPVCDGNLLGERDLRDRCH
jgi:hypothetical protein